MDGVRSTPTPFSVQADFAARSQAQRAGTKREGAHAVRELSEAIKNIACRAAPTGAARHFYLIFLTAGVQADFGTELLKTESRLSAFETTFCIALVDSCNSCRRYH